MSDSVELRDHGEDRGVCFRESTGPIPGHAEGQRLKVKSLITAASRSCLLPRLGGRWLLYLLEQLVEVNPLAKGV